MLERIACVMLIGALCSLAGATCYKLVYVDSACALAPCHVPADPPACEGPEVLQNWPVYTTRNDRSGFKRTTDDRACEVVWTVRGADGECNVKMSCLNQVGSFNLDVDVECHTGVPQ